MSVVMYVFIHVCISKGVYVSIEIALEEWEVVWLPLIPLSNFLWFNNHIFLLSHMQRHDETMKPVMSKALSNI